MMQSSNTLNSVQIDLSLELTKKLEIYFGKNKLKILKQNLKEDQSIVTEIDLFVSLFLKQKLKLINEYSHYSFFSEEEYGDLQFPAVILDPIDGTRELVLGRPECAVSLALMVNSKINHPDNYAWIYNPFSGFSLDSKANFVTTMNKSKQKILGLVSRREYEKGFFKEMLNIDQKIEITPRGSIAFKLGLLASGACDFVLSLSPKNIWDIAAGSILCEQRGIYLYQNGKRISSLDDVKLNGMLLWSTEELSTILIPQFKNEKERQLNLK